MTALLSFVAGPIGRWVVIGLLIASAVAAAGMRAYNAGYSAHEAETSAATAAANSESRRAERAASERMTKLATIHHQEIEHARIETDRLRADLRSGARRLSVPTTPGISGRADSAPAGGVVAETRTELAGSVAETLVAIAGEGDDAIRKSNALIDAYMLAAEVCGK